MIYISSNNVVWVLFYKGYYHVWYSGCYDNVPKRPDQNGLNYQWFDSRKDALVYGHDVVKGIESIERPDGLPYIIEYGVVEL